MDSDRDGLLVQTAESHYASSGRICANIISTPSNASAKLDQHVFPVDSATDGSLPQAESQIGCVSPPEKPIIDRGSGRYITDNLCLNSPATNQDPQSIVRQCRCHWRRETQRFGPSGRMEIVLSRSIRHDVDCSRHSSSSEEHEVSFRMNLGIWGQYGGLHATLKTVTIAGAFVLGRSLICRRTVSRQNAAVKLLSLERAEDIRRADSLTSAANGIESTMQELCTLLATGQASPADVTEDGKTLIHQAYVFIWAALPATDNESLYPACRTLIRELVKAGTPSDEADEFGATPLDHLMCITPNWSPLAAHLCDDLLQLGADGSKSSNSRYWQIEVLRASNAVADGVGLSELGQAIIQKSEARLSAALRRRTSIASKQMGHFPGGTSAVHLASGWPQGLKMLIEFGAELGHADRHGDQPLRWAIRKRNVVCMRMLIQAGCPMDDFVELLDEALHACNSKRSHVAPAYMANLLITGFKGRRQVLKDIATSNIPAIYHDQLGLNNCVTLDDKAYIVAQRLETVDIVLPQACRLPSTGYTAYHGVGGQFFDVGIAQTLRDAGFHDLIRTDDQDLSPFDNIMCSMSHWHLDPEYSRRQVELAVWLLSHGERNFILGRRLQLLKHAARLGCVVRSCFEIVGSVQLMPEIHHVLDSWLNLRARAYLEVLLDTRAKDSCRCHCSLQGCSGLNVIIQRLSRFRPRTLPCSESYDIRHTSFAKHMSTHFLTLLETALGSDNQLWPSLAPQIIRAQIFEDSDVRHTCCKQTCETGKGGIRYLRPSIRTCKSEEEVDELHDEDAEAIGRVEALIPVVEEAYQTTSLSLAEFLAGTYDLILEDFRRVQQSTAVHDLVAIREIGVVFDAPLIQVPFNSSAGNEDDALTILPKQYASYTPEAPYSG